jgi:hypothetical protein
MNRYFFYTLIAASAFVCWAEQPVATQKRMLIFLKEPILENSVIVHLDNTKRVLSLEKKEKIDPVVSSSHKMIYQRRKNSKRSISLILSEPGFIKLEIYDFYGKHLSTLYKGWASKGKMIIEEGPEWKKFKKFKGVAFITLSLNGKIELRKLLPKVD